MGDAPDEDEGGNTMLVVFIVIGSVLFLAIAVVFVKMQLNKRKNLIAVDSETGLLNEAREDKVSL